MKTSSRLFTHAALAALILIWGTTWGAIRIGLAGIPPFGGVAARFALAAAVLFGWAKLRGIRFGTGRHERRLWAINTVLGFCLSYGVVYWAEQWVPSGLSAVLFSTFPLFVAALAHPLIPGERLEALSVAGLLVGFAGVAVIFSEDLGRLGGERMWLGSLVLLTSPLTAAVASVSIKKWGRGVHPLSLGAVPMALTGAVMGLVALAFERHRPWVFDAASVGALLYLAILGSAVTFTLYYWLMERVAVTRLSLITYGIPVVAVLFGTLLLDEPFTARMAAGSALVIAGVALVVRSGRRRPGRGAAS